MQTRDGRVKLTSEALEHMSFLKLFNWERHLGYLIEGMRTEELELLR